MFIPQGLGSDSDWVSMGIVSFLSTCSKDSCNRLLLASVDNRYSVSFKELYSLIDMITTASSSLFLGTTMTSIDLATASKYFFIFLRKAEIVIAFMRIIIVLLYVHYIVQI